jgi:hypothetical protein
VYPLTGIIGRVDVFTLLLAPVVAIISLLWALTCIAAATTNSGTVIEYARTPVGSSSPVHAG